MAKHVLGAMGENLRHPRKQPSGNCHELVAIIVLVSGLEEKLEEIGLAQDKGSDL